MSQRLQGKIALITGGNSGIGLATAKLFREEGAQVIITGRDKTTIDKAVSELGVIGFQSDSGNIADIEKLSTEIHKKFDRLDILFANAGIAKFLPLEQVTPEFYEEQFNINVRGPLFLTQKIVPLMKNGGSVIYNTSVVTAKGMPNSSVYSATKAALRSITRTLAGELVDKKIRVNTVSPGPIATPIYGRLGLPQEALDQMGQSILTHVPMKRFGTADEIAKVALFLATDDAAFMTGGELFVDGGMADVDRF